MLTDPVNGGEFTTGDAARARYREYLTGRLAASNAFVSAAIAARDTARSEPKRRVQARR